VHVRQKLINLLKSFIPQWYGKWKTDSGIRIRNRISTKC